MGSALGCASQKDEEKDAGRGKKEKKATKKGGGKETGNAGAADGGGGGGDGDKADKSELQGKMRYLGEVGSVVHGVGTKKQITGYFIAYLDKDTNDTCFSYYNVPTKEIFTLQLTDEEFKTLKEQQNITHSFNAVYKSIVTEIVKRKTKVTCEDESCVATFGILSVKDPKDVQPLEVYLQPNPTPHGMIKYILEPFIRMILTKRLKVDEQSQEMHISRIQMQAKMNTASLAIDQATIERIQKSIIPLREKAAKYSKFSSELVSKIDQTERKIKKLKNVDQHRKNVLDSIYEDGGAQYFPWHLPDAEEQYPVVAPCNEEMIDMLKGRFPLKEGETLASLLEEPSDPELKKIHDPKIKEMLHILQHMDLWDMSVFDLEKATGGNACYVISCALLYKLGLVQQFNINEDALRLFFKNVQAGYHPNPYHNKSHAADVAQINYFILTQGGLIEKCNLTREDILGAVIAGPIHDYDHPGFNNNFHTKTNAYLSTLYNDRSVLENHHLNCIYEMLRLPQYDIFANLNEQQKRTVREIMTEMVLATDMGNHARIFTAFRRRLTECTNWADKREDQLLALSISIKMADISNCGRPNALYLEWAKNISAEFYLQGDAEERRSMPISPFMDRKKDKTDFPKGQISFMNYVVVPMFEAVAEFLPPVEQALHCCSDNKEYWQGVLE